MTDEEIINKAKETSGGNYHYEQGFIYGFELGEENGRKEKETDILDKWCRGKGDECQFLEKLAKENAELKQKLESDELALNEATEIVAELKAQLEKMKSFIHSEIDFCMYCPLTNECKNDEGTCPYAYATEEEQKNLLMDFIKIRN